jgi:UDP-N-acetylglucosamine:LPS N-acetylglucosamine transferase
MKLHSFKLKAGPSRLQSWELRTQWTVTLVPRFLHGLTRVLFFSRGRGHGHAIPDMSITDELHALRNDVDVRFVSYAVGALTFTENGRPVIDLELPDPNPFLETLVRSGRLIDQVKPDLVISHEEFAALPAAGVLGVPSIFLTDWFMGAEHWTMETLQYADETVFLGEPGIFEEPPTVRGKVNYVGPALLRFSYTRSDRERARRELRYPPDATIILVAPGSATEEEEPICEVVVRAFDVLDAPRKLLVWLAGADCEMLARRFRGRADVLIKQYDWQMDRLMAAVDFAITKGTRITLQELASLGIPSASLSRGRNSINDSFAARVPTNASFDASSIESEALARHISAALSANAQSSTENTSRSRASSDGARKAAARLDWKIRCLPARG